MVKEQFFERGFLESIKSSDDAEEFDVIINFENIEKMEDFFKKMSGKYGDILHSLNISEKDIKNNIKNPNELFKKFENETLSPTVLRITTSIAAKLPKGLLFVISEKGEEMGIRVIEKDEYIFEM
jgi:hypothetical protein